jgi:hypothetical protein
MFYNSEVPILCINHTHFPAWKIINRNTRNAIEQMRAKAKANLQAKHLNMKAYRSVQEKPKHS